MSNQPKSDPALAAAQIVLITLVCSSAIPVFLSNVLRYEAIPHVEAKVEEEAEPEKPVVIKPVELRRGETPELLQHLFAEAERYGADPEKMRRTIDCESAGWHTDIQSWHRRPDGSRERSYGLAQIYLPAHPQVSENEAKNPYYAITFMAQHFGENNGAIWTCYRKLFGSSPSTI